MKDKYCIGDLAKHYGISTDTLRLYDRQGVLLSHRAPNGYRYYTRTDFICLGYILRLRKNNMPLADIGPLMHGGSLESVADAARLHDAKLAEKRLELDALYESNRRFLAEVNDTIRLLGKIELCISPRMITRDLSIPFSQAIDLFRALPGRPEPKMVFRVHRERAISPEYERALLRARAEDFGTELILALEDKSGKLQLPENSGLSVIQPHLCLLAGICCRTGVDYTSHVHVLQYAAEHGFRINGDIILSPALHAPSPDASVDYYRLYIPVEPVGAE